MSLNKQRLIIILIVVVVPLINTIKSVNGQWNDSVQFTVKHRGWHPLFFNT